MSTEQAIFERLQRIETRMVRGFEELGVKVTDDADWFERDGSKVYLKGPGRSIRAIQLAIRDSGGYDEFYQVIVNGEVIATVKGV